MCAGEQSDAAGMWILPKRSTLKGRAAMLYAIAVILLVLWLLGLVSSYTIGGLIHVLLVIAIVVLLLGVIGGRRSL
jgi:hypothetical protein